VSYRKIDFSHLRVSFAVGTCLFSMGRQFWDRPYIATVWCFWSHSLWSVFPHEFSVIYFQLTLSLIMRDGCSWLMSDSQLIWRLSTFHKDTHLIFILLWLFTYSRWNKSCESNLFQSHEMIPFLCFTSNTSLIKMQCSKYLYNIFHWTITE
jgi:hypothetical protein